jgi:tRNA(fMet)-specific endonuclease VapC
MARPQEERQSGMTPVVVDTDVVSYIFKHHPRAESYLPHIEGRPTLISFMTEAELERWALQANWGEVRFERLRQFLRRFLIVPSSEHLSRKWAAVMVQARAVGLRIETADAWVAATALLYQAPLVTNNPTDYAGVSGLQVISDS